MRIIGGKYISRVLVPFDGEEVRPTADRVKESLFNILALKMYGANVLDLFSGSGALGLESLSRGAKKVTFNDFSKDSIAILKKNLKALKVDEKEYQLFNYDYNVCLGVVNGPFDLIFIDPPYKQEFGEIALQKIAQRGLLSENGIAVYERDRAFQGNIDGLELYDERKYGKTYVSFFRKIKTDDEEESV